MALVGQHFPLFEVKPYCIFLKYATGLPCTGKPVFFVFIQLIIKLYNEAQILQ